MKKFWVLILLSVAGFGQAAPAPAAVKPHRPAVAAKSIVDNVIDLVKNGMSEALVIRQLQREGKSYELTTPDLVKLQKAGVSENIINVMLDPKTTPEANPSPAAPNLWTNKDSTPGGAPPAPAPPPPASADTPAIAGETPYPPDLPNAPAVRKRRVVITPFRFGALGNQIQALYYPQWAVLYSGTVPANKNVTDDLGLGIRAMLMNRLQQTNAITVLERNADVDEEVKQGPSASMDPGTRPRIGGKWGADSVVTGDITTFGRDDKNKCAGGLAGALSKRFGAIAGGALCKKEDKAVVAIEFRIVDAETSEVLMTASAKGQSLRKSNRADFGGLGIGTGGAGGGGGSLGTNTSNFEKTILGEATSNAVDQIVKQIQENIPQLPAKPRKIEGRVAQITPNGIYLALGSNDGVLLGDRFEIRQINNQVLDPQTHEAIATEAVKVGELVVSEVEEKSSIGNYGGHPLSPDYITGKGYQARLMSK